MTITDLKRKIKNTWHRITHWEYWPDSVLYYPLFPIWMLWSLRNRSLFFFNAVNPGMPYGGLTMDSKMKIYNLMPDGSYPQTLFINTKDQLNRYGLERRLKSAGMNFPVVVKPDIGFKGLGVYIAHNIDELKKLQAQQEWPFLIQEYVSYSNEIGIFYVRMPGEEQGRITGIVDKKFLSVKGDGVSSLGQLIEEKPRARIQYDYLFKTFVDQWDQVIEKDEELILIPLGSHTRGAEFIDISDQLSPELEKHILKLGKEVQGFYYGRLDILYKSKEDLQEAKNLKVIEINGSGSEPTHIYDPKHSILFAWKEVIRHGLYMYRIARANKRRGHAYLSAKEGFAMMKEHRSLARFLDSL